jgi:hypothetical protein
MIPDAYCDKALRIALLSVLPLTQLAQVISERFAASDGSFRDECLDGHRRADRESRDLFDRILDRPCFKSRKPVTQEPFLMFMA